MVRKMLLSSAAVFVLAGCSQKKVETVTDSTTLTQTAPAPEATAPEKALDTVLKWKDQTFHV